MFLNKETSQQGSALLIGLLITVLLSILVIGFLEKVLRSGQNIKSIEQSTQAYYNATSIIERQLQANEDLKRSPWKIEEKTDDNAKLEVFGKSTSVPHSQKGNAQKDSDYNIISLQNPIQLAIPNVSWSGVKIHFRIPEIDGLEISNNSPLSPNPSQNDILMWAIGNDKKVLFPKNGESFSDLDIGGNGVSLNTKTGYYFDDNNPETETTIVNFVDQELKGCNNNSCFLKISLLKPVKVTINGNIVELPFLEYKIDFGDTEVPDQNITLESTGTKGQYIRKRKVVIPQITTNTALDFAILQ